jgi:hypothetical protein
MPAVGLTPSQAKPSRAVIAEDVRDLKLVEASPAELRRRRSYGAGGSSGCRLARLRRGAPRPSSGLSILAIIPVGRPARRRLWFS